MTDQTKKALLAKAEKITKESGDTMQGTMFLNGADWYRHNIWHPASEPPKPNISGLMVRYKDHTLGFVNMDDVSQVRLDIVSTGWAYLEDILPEERTGGFID